MSKKLTTKEFIQRARKVHGTKYDYSQVEYINARTKVKIICPEHGVFEQTPDKHLGSKHGCTQCGEEMSHINHRNSCSDIISRFRCKHGNKYDYSQVIYRGYHIKVKIICPEHGEFWQTPANHLSGKGCKVCSGNKIAEALRVSSEEFIQKATAEHENKYDYSQVDYVNARTKVKIICPIHGLFEQTPDNHLSGRGCQKCGRQTTKFKRKKLYDAGIIQQKIYETRKKNGTLNTSQPEEDLYELLCNKFGIDNVIRQYKESRYPFNCDFYIKSLDLFIELNANWTHGRGLGFYDENNPEHHKLLQNWKDGDSRYYKAAIQTWTERDIKKRDTAIQNNLNYKVFWNNDLSDAKAWLNSI